MTRVLSLLADTVTYFFDNRVRPSLPFVADLSAPVLGLSTTFSTRWAATHGEAVRKT
jgi:hypothetical protein